MADTVSWSGYLKISVNRRGYDQRPWLWQTSASISKGKPATARDEIAVKIQVDLPASLFIRPQVEAKITMPESAVTPLTLDLQVIDNVREIIQQQTGFDVRVIADGKEQP